MRQFHAYFLLAVLFATTAAQADLTTNCTIMPKSKLAGGPELTSLQISAYSLRVKGFLTKLNDKGTLFERFKEVEYSFQGPASVQMVGDERVLIALPHSVNGQDLPVHPDYRLLLVWSEANRAFEGMYMMNRVSCTVEE